MKPAVVFVAAVSLAGIWQKMTQPTNSAAATARGLGAYARQQPAEAVAEFGTATAIDPSAQNQFNLGTAQIAAGQRAAGSATLTKAMADPALRARALFNRGNSALAANAYDHAIRDYTDALRLTPGDRDAKRNLEIALQRQESQQQQQQSGGQNNQQGGSNQQQQQAPQPAPQQSEQRQGEADAEALLRSVQQQEQEELSRMKRARGDSRRVGW
ncbi:MAG TPA: tetratricopeptide repeat protein [Thermoanaerobaculia bacterium]